jgi:hypothetical protein
MKITFEQKKSALSDALKMDHCYIIDFNDSTVFYKDMMDGGSQSYEQSYTMDKDGKVTLSGSPIAVKPRTVYDRIQETVLIEATQIQEDGTIKDCVLIAPGESKNRTDYSPAMLSANAHLFEGLAAYSGHKILPDGRVDVAAKSDPRNLAGKWSNARYVETKGIVADLLPFESAAPVITTAREAGSICGISIDMAADFKVRKSGRKAVREATAFRASEFNSADIVVNPAAGGRLFESAINPWWTQFEQEQITMKHTLEAIKANPTAWRLVEALVPQDERQGLTVDALTEKYPDCAKAVETVMDIPAEEPKAEPKPEAARVTETVQPDKTSTEATKVLDEIRLERHAMAVEKRLQESKLPASFITLGVNQFSGRICEMAVVDSYIQETKKALDAATGSGRVRENGGQISMGDEGIDKCRKAIEGMFAGQDVDGVPRFRNMKHAFGTFSGATWGDNISADRILRETHGGGYDSERAREAAMLSTSWAQVFGDVMHKRMIVAFNSDGEQEWRKLTSFVGDITDFKTQHRPKFGGFGIPPSVAENGTYQPAAVPGDDEETFAVGKYGYLYDITLEAIQNDDMNSIRQVPTRMGRAAKVGLNRFVFNLFVGNPTLGDSVALFHTDSTLRGGNGSTAASGNLATTAFSSAQVEVRRINMVQRAAYGTTIGGVKVDVAAFRPKNIIVPPNLEKTAWTEVTSLVAPTNGTAGQNNSTEPNFSRTQNYEVIVMPWASNAKDWYLEADPTQGDTLEVGFLNGRQEPEVFTKQEFEVDKITHKIRFIYGGVVLEPLAWDFNDVA